MNKLLKLSPMILVSILLISCATTVNFSVEHPPLVDLRDVNTITVIPLEWKDNGKYSYLANDLTKALTLGIKKQKRYNFINPDILKNIDESNYWEYVDVYILCGIINAESQDEYEKREEQNGKTKIYVTRTVTVSIEYQYIRTIDDEVLGTFNKNAVSAVTFDDSDRSSKWWGELLLDIFFPKGKSVEKIAKSAVQKFSNNMNRELFTWTTVEKRRIEESTGKNNMFAEAEKMVRREKYFEALILYKNIYEETGSVVAGYNTVLLLEANGQFNDALALLEELDEKIAKTGLNSPPFIKNEIKTLEGLINDLEILDEYKK